MKNVDSTAFAVSAGKQLLLLARRLKFQLFMRKCPVTQSSQSQVNRQILTTASNVRAFREMFGGVMGPETFVMAYSVLRYFGRPNALMHFVHSIEEECNNFVGEEKSSRRENNTKDRGMKEVESCDPSSSGQV